MATHKRIILAGRIYTHSRENFREEDSYLNIAFPDTKSSTTPPEDNLETISLAENYNHACRMLLRANTRKYCERCEYRGECVR